MKIQIFTLVHSKAARLTAKNRSTGSKTIESVSLSSSVKLYGYGKTCEPSALPRKKFATNDWFDTTAFGFGGASLSLADVAKHLVDDAKEITKKIVKNSEKQTTYKMKISFVIIKVQLVSPINKIVFVCLFIFCLYNANIFLLILMKRIEK